MDKLLIFDFEEDISTLSIPKKLNNPFGLEISEIAKIAVKEFQHYISLESKNWEYDFLTEKGKMFGILVVQRKDNSYGYLGTISGKIPNNYDCKEFIPSVFDASLNDFFFDKGMIELAELSGQIKNCTNDTEINWLKIKRKQKSILLQKWLFESYRFLNVLGMEQNVVEIFEASSHGNPPAAAGECAAPKLINYALKNNLKPISLAEFWWGSSIANKEKEHKKFYPACKNKCRPILEFMLNDNDLYDSMR